MSCVSSDACAGTHVFSKHTKPGYTLAGAVLRLALMSESPSSRRSRHNRGSLDIPSPLDAFLLDFLQWLAQREHGLSLTRDGHVVAEAFGWPPPFVEALLVSARARRLITQEDSRRGRVTWRISERGRSWLTARQQDRANETAEALDSPAIGNQSREHFVPVAHLAQSQGLTFGPRRKEGS